MSIRHYEKLAYLFQKCLRWPKLIYLLLTIIVLTLIDLGYWMTCTARGGRFCPPPSIFPTRSQDTSKGHKCKIVENGWIMEDGDWNFWKIFINKKVMSKKQNIDFDIRKIVSAPVKKWFMVTKPRKSDSAWKTGL